MGGNKETSASTRRTSLLRDSLLSALKNFNQACKWVSAVLKSWAFLDVLERLGRLAILIAIVSWMLEIPARRKAQEDQRKGKIYQAWQVINSAEGKPGSGGRAEAISDLVSERQSLRGINLYGGTDSSFYGGTYLPGLKLRQQDLREANFVGAHLEGADFRGSNLQEATFNGATLSGADFRGARLWATKLNNVDLSDARFTDSILTKAELSGSVLERANLENADLSDADLSKSHLFRASLASARFGGAATLEGADLREAILRNADFEFTVLKDADLEDADLAGATFSYANLRGVHLKNARNWSSIKAIAFANLWDVRDAPAGFVDWAIGKGALFIDSDEEWNKRVDANLPPSTK
jgi:uncharacterized protein YjbI with pentapeptide repeats